MCALCLFVVWMLNRVLIQWRSEKDYERWVTSDEYKKISKDINELLDVPSTQTRVLKTPHDDIFLL